MALRLYRAWLWEVDSGDFPEVDPIGVGSGSGGGEGEPDIRRQPFLTAAARFGEVGLGGGRRGQSAWSTFDDAVLPGSWSK